MAPNFFSVVLFLAKNIIYYRMNEKCHAIQFHIYTYKYNFVLIEHAIKLKDSLFAGLFVWCVWNRQITRNNMDVEVAPTLSLHITSLDLGDRSDCVAVYSSLEIWSGHSGLDFLWSSRENFCEKLRANHHFFDH